MLRPKVAAFLGASIILASCSSSTLATTTNSVGRTSTTVEAGRQGSGGAECPTSGETLDTAKLYIEHNATDADTGVHGLLGGSAWSELCIWDPNGELILVVDPLRQLNDLTVSDLFFESREPPNDEFSITDLMAAFPEGEYTVGGTDFEGISRVARARFTHDIPQQPSITAPVFAVDEESASGALVERNGLTVSWDPVGEALDGRPIEISGYEVIITKVDHDDPNGLTRPVYDVHVGPNSTSLGVVPEFLESTTLYELEVLAIEVSGNQTITVGFFTTK